MSDVENHQMDKRVAPRPIHQSASFNGPSSQNARTPKSQKPKSVCSRPYNNFSRADSAQNFGPNQLRNKVTNVGELGSVYNPYRGRKGDKGGRGKTGFGGHEPLGDDMLDHGAHYSQHNWKATRTRYVSHSEGYNKEKFLLANCQFVVREGRDYSAHLTNADLLVDWEHVEELRLYCSDMCVCPICLSPPTAAQMTRCGHVFCWPCILHYLALSDKPWRKCPICYESVYGAQLKSVIALQVCKVSVGDTLEMELMQRQKGSVVALPKTHYELNHAAMQRSDDTLKQFAKMVIVSADEVERGTLQREVDELRVRLEEEKDEPESCFIRQAIELLYERKRSLQNVVNGTDEEQENQEGLESVEEDLKVDLKGEAFEGAVASPKHSPKESNMAQANPKHYFFYQASDGQQIYLHPINAQCLTHEYGSLEESPTKLKGKVAQLEHVTMTAQMRDRMRYLGHLPLKTNFILAEVVLDKQVLSKETLHHFADQLSARERERRKKLRSENQLTKRAERWQNVAFMNAASFAREGQIRRPDEVSVSTFVRSAQQDLAIGWSADDDRRVSESSNDQTDPGPGQEDLAQTVPSFAQMLRQGKPKAATVSGGLSNLAKIEPPAAVAQGQDEEESLPAPSYQSAFGDAIAMALDKVNSSSGEAQTAGKKSKKKKNKGMVLFSI